MSREVHANRRTVDSSKPLAVTNIEGGGRPSIELIELVTNVLDTPVEELDPLGDSIDPEALDALLATEGSTGFEESVSVEFVYQGFSVHADSEGSIRLRKR